MTSPSTDTVDYAWRVEAGEREQLVIPVQDGAGVPFAIVGWTIDAAVKDRPGGTVLYQFPPEHAELAVDGQSVTLTIPAPISAAWTFTVGWWRLKVTEPSPPADDPDVQRIAQGSLIVDPD